MPWERDIVIWKDEAEDSCSSSSVRGCLLKRTCVKHAVCISVGLWQLPVTSRPLRNSCWDCVCLCVSPCVIASVCWCKSHVKCAGGGVEEVRCVGCKHFVCLCYVIQQQWNKWHTLICLSGSTVCGEQLSRSKHLSALFCLWGASIDDVPPEIQRKLGSPALSPDKNILDDSIRRLCKTLDYPQC